MEQEQLQRVAAAIGYIEARLDHPPDLQSVAGAVHYSKYHLHRIFTATVGIPLHDYIRRRQLTRAAERLVFTSDPIARVAQWAGYESQQAFTGIFGAMYKHTPLEYRRRGRFYPLQLPFTPCAAGAGTGEVAFAEEGDIGDWMELTRLIVGGFPCFDAGEHQRRLEEYILRRQALVLRDSEGFLTGAAAFSPRTGSLDFLGVHPQYRRRGAGEALLSHLLDRDLLPGDRVSITTFRAGDRADPGQRADYQRLGFREGELLTEFDYPTQRLFLDRGEGAGLYGYRG